MRLPLQITFRNMDPSAAVEAKIRDKADKLDRFHHHIMSCRVAVEADHKHRHKGNLYHVRVDLSVPGHEILASKQSAQNHAHEDLYVAVRDAFEAARRQLESLAAKRRGEVKAHEMPPHGRIAQINGGKDFGIIQTADGREIYFHRNSVLGAEFEQLVVGDEVRFAESTGDEGPQASTVTVVGKHHIPG